MGLFTKLNWILEGTMFGRNKLLVNVPAIYRRGVGGEQESVVLLVCAEGLPYAPGEPG